MTIQCYDEIVTQELAWKEAVEVASAQKSAASAFIECTQPTRVLFAGCTSPYYGGLCAASFWNAETSLEADAFPSSELVLFPHLYYPRAGKAPVMLALSRSGKTTETIWAMEAFELRFPGRSALIGCSNLDGPLAQMASLKLFLPRSNETTTPQTRSLSAMLLLSMLLGSIAGKNESIEQLLMAAPKLAGKIVAKAEPVVEGLFRGKCFQNIFILGSGPLYGMAREFGLKCMEMSTTDSFSYPFLESRHGPRALIDENTLVIGLYSRAGARYEARVMDEITRNHHATTLAVTPETGWETGAVTATAPVDCGWPDSMLSLAYLPVGQLAAYHCAMARGFNPDVARNHTSFVEIERF